MAAENYFLAMLVALNSSPLSHCTGSLSHMLVWQSFELHSFGVSRRKEWSNVHESAQRESQTVETHIQELVQIHIWQHNSLINASEVKSNKKHCFFVFDLKNCKAFLWIWEWISWNTRRDCFSQVDKFTKNEIDTSISRKGCFSWLGHIFSKLMKVNMSSHKITVTACFTAIWKADIGNNFDCVFSGRHYRKFAC